MVMEQKPDAVQEVRQFLTTLRIIVLALAAGVSIFVGYVLMTEAPDARDKPLLTMYMAIFAAVGLLGRLLIPGLVFGATRRKIARGTWQPDTQPGQPPLTTDDGLLMAAFQMKTIIGCAILEGAGFANAYAFMAERRMESLAITLALIVMIAAHFPLRFWLDGWLERQKRWLDEERSLRPPAPHAS